MDGNIEIRKLSVASTYNLMQYLESSLLWKELMVNIPKYLDNDSFVQKYSYEQVALIEDAAIKQKRLCSEILFEEWGTSGRRRPTIQDLLELLIKNEMYRAADIVSEELLKGGPVVRPERGPAAKIDTSLTRILREYPVNRTEIDNILEDMSYPSTISNAGSIFNKNLDNIVAVSNSANSVGLNGSDNQSDANLGRTIPSFSTLLIGDDAGPSRADHLTPALSMLLKSEPLGTATLTEEQSNLDDEETGVDLPNLSIMIHSAPDESSYSEEIIPALSALQDCSKTRPFGNILPVSLSTDLPHMKYEDIRAATGDFGETSDVTNRRGGIIGSGGFGVVYLAIDLLAEPVAVKRLSRRSDVSKYDELIAKQFRAEVEVLSRYVHPNIVSLLGYSCDGPDYCLMYEFVDGGSLREKLNEGRLPWSDRLRIAIGISAGIEHLHASSATPLIHRDVKSANILLTMHCVPKLCDFGLAKFLINQSDTTTIIGTSAYMAPETFRGDVSVKMDVFSFGVVLLELLTGLPPTDELRTGVDLFTHVMEVCADNHIGELLDKNAGDWRHCDEVFCIALTCLEDKRKRPDISRVKDGLEKICLRC